MNRVGISLKVSILIPADKRIPAGVFQLAATGRCQHRVTEVRGEYDWIDYQYIWKIILFLSRMIAHYNKEQLLTGLGELFSNMAAFFKVRTLIDLLQIYCYFDSFELVYF